MFALLRVGVRQALFVAWLVVVAAPLALAQSDPLPSWNDGAVKRSITDFVTRVATQGGGDLSPSSSASRLSTMTARSGPLDEATARFWTVVDMKQDCRARHRRIRAWALRKAKFAGVAAPAKPVSDKEAQQIAKEAYIYGVPRHFSCECSRNQIADYGAIKS
jgi:hypothetical protein